MTSDRLHVFVLIDALGWKFLQQTPFLDDVLPYRQPLRTILGFSSGVIPSILTGLTPAESAVWNLVYYDPEHSPFRWMRHFQSVPRPLLDNRYARRAFTELGRRVLGLGHGFDCCVSPRLLHYFNWAERRNIYDPGGIPGVQSIFDKLVADGVPYRSYSYHRNTDEEILQAVPRHIDEGHENFYFVYLSEVDKFLHDHCSDPARIAERLAWYDRQLRHVFDAALRRDPEACFYLFSDHGMTPVTRHYDLAADVERASLSTPKDFLAVYDSTMARFWCFSDAARDALTRQLEQVPCGHILSHGELKSLLLSFSDNRYGDIIFLMDPGCLIASSAFHSASWMPVGMHGYHPDDEHSYGVFLTNREILPPVTIVTDIYRCMREAIS